ncbi:GNAT family N-acetyltransferase [Actinomadura hibisca]|uniref:GNAT family N-acetyltransferase n=1 Tax=Actinomadura hibisca TaxID=68565 RepID=UPI0009FC6A70|nr:GNAT family N-acetyltransferase [Actinomadura hibisca]
MTGLEVLDPRHDPEPAYWESLVARAGRRAVWSYDLLRVAAWTARHPLLLTVVRDGDAPAAVVCASLAGVRGRGYAGPGVPRLSLPTVQVPGSPAERGWWFAGSPSPAERRDLLRRYVRGTRRLLGHGRPGVLWLRAGEDDRAAVPGAVRLVRPLHPVARLATPWNDIEDWYASLPRSRRGDLRRQRRGLAHLDCRLGPARELTTGAEAAALLWRNEDKYRGGPFPSPPLPLPYVEAMVARPDVLAVAYRDARDRLVGVGLLLDHPRWPLYWRWGALPARHLYFDAYTRLMEWAVGAGRTGIILGKGKPSLKASLGAELEPSYAIAAAP